MGAGAFPRDTASTTLHNSEALDETGRAFDVSLVRFRILDRLHHFAFLDDRESIVDVRQNREHHQRQQRRPVDEPSEQKEHESEILGMARVSIDSRGDELLLGLIQRGLSNGDDRAAKHDEPGIDDGMAERVAIAIALAAEPDL